LNFDCELQPVLSEAGENWGWGSHVHRTHASRQVTAPRCSRAYSHLPDPHCPTSGLSEQGCQGAGRAGASAPAHAQLSCPGACCHYSSLASGTGTSGDPRAAAAETPPYLPC